MSQTNTQNTQEQRPIFTEEMRKEYTILIPTMLPTHFTFLCSILNQHGYHVEQLRNESRSVIEEGLRNVHNDTCYPALLVIGQMIDALKSGKYDPHKVALLITQTGGGCRASNYIHLLRKALKKSGYGYVPVISFSIGGLEKNPGFQIGLSLLDQLLYAVMLGDLLMLLANQCRPYEVEPGSTDALVSQWIDRLVDFLNSQKVVRYKAIKQFYHEIVQSFAALPRQGEQKPRVGIVGEIYVKYSPLGNNHLEDFLASEGAEVVVPGLLDFCLYCVYNNIHDRDLYGGSLVRQSATKVVYDFLLKKQREMLQVVRDAGFFTLSNFDHTATLAKGYINSGVKMGEGWLLTAEMVELVENGVNNIVCTQPFGCLPNHIVGKGMMRAIKEKNPQANIVAVDYDPGASEINQQNRIKLMLANAQLEKRKGGEA